MVAKNAKGCYDNPEVEVRWQSFLAGWGLCLSSEARPMTTAPRDGTWIEGEWLIPEIGSACRSVHIEEFRVIPATFCGSDGANCWDKYESKTGFLTKPDGWRPLQDKEVSE